MSPRTSTKPILPCHHQHPPSPPSAATSTTVRHSGGSSLFSGGRSTRTGGKKGKLGFHVHRDKRTGKKQLRPETEKALAIKNDFVACVAEFIGTTSFLFFAFGGTNVANGGAQAAQTDTDASGVGSITDQVDTSKLMYISLAFGFSLLVNVWIFFRVSGGLFNPAVSFALCLTKNITPFRAAILTVSQILGGIVAAALIYCLTPGPLNIATTLSPGMNVVQGVFLEMFLTALLVTTILLLAVEKHRATYVAPVGIGLALFICELTGVTYTGGSLNPSRSFGPCVVGREFPHYHWTYWVGPYLGALLAVGLYKFLGYMDYGTVNPDQDATFEGQAPIHVVINEKSGKMELDKDLHETTTDPSEYIKEKVRNVVRSPSKESVQLIENVDDRLAPPLSQDVGPSSPSLPSASHLTPH